MCSVTNTIVRAGVLIIHRALWPVPDIWPILLIVTDCLFGNLL